MLRTKGDHGFVGYAEIYLGKWGKRISLLSGVSGLVGSLLVYLIVVGTFLNRLFPFFSQDKWVLLFSLLGFFLFYQGLRFSSKVGILAMVFLIAALILISFFSLPHFNPENIFLGSRSSWFLPYGVAMFSLVGSSSIPDLVKLFGRKNGVIKQSIILGTLIPAVLYIFFMLAVVGATGTSTTPEAVKGLESVIGRTGVILGSAVGVLAVFTSYLVLGLYTKRVLVFDLKLPKFLGVAFSAGVPLVFYLAGFRSFVGIIGLIGAVGIGIDGVLTFLVHRQAQKTGELDPPYKINLKSWAVFLVVALLLAGAMQEIFKF